jgi:glyoxylase-like metal-dependent hydrolase (beta-lactamase superfamily II)
MRRALIFLFLTLVVAAGALAVTFLPQRLDVPRNGAMSAPEADVPEGISLKAILGGKLFSQAVFAYRGGGVTDGRVFGMGSILVEHPKGRLLIDAGLASNAMEHLQTMPWLMRTMSNLETETAVPEHLKAAGIAPQSLAGVVLTHAHWDHVSGLADMPGVPVFVPQAELDFIRSGHHMTALARRLGTDDYQVYAFSDGPYLGFPESHDFFGDGSVVIVPAPGHTPGSVFVFVTVSSGKRYVMIGDTAWQIEGIDLPAEKPWLARRLVDVYPEQIRSLLVRLHVLQRDIPGLTVVPAHDRRVWEALPRLGE